jgi:hypothetical protein
MKVGESVGLEVLVDVHTTLSSHKSILVQLKHTTKTTAEDKKQNLTTLDRDLWKTLYNWASIISDNLYGRDSIREQVLFTQSTDFLLVTNKSLKSSNRVISAIQKYQEGEKTHQDLLNVLVEYLDLCKDQKIQNYIKKVVSLADSVSDIFFKNVRFDFLSADIIQKCKTAIKEKFISENKIDFVFNQLNSELREECYHLMVENQKVIFTHEDVCKKCRRIFDLAINSELVFEDRDFELPKNLIEQTFIEQMLDIDDVSDDEILYFTQQRLKLRTNLAHFRMNGDLTRKEIDDFNQEAKNRWRNIHRQAHRSQENALSRAQNEVDPVGWTAFGRT